MECDSVIDVTEDDSSEQYDEQDQSEEYEDKNSIGSKSNEGKYVHTSVLNISHSVCISLFRICYH